MPEKFKEYLDHFIDEMDGDTKDEKFRDLLQKSEEMALAYFYDFRRNFKFYREQRCPGAESFCGIPKKQYEDLCECCQEAQEVEV
jgi:hypothetical protein